MVTSPPIHWTNGPAFISTLFVVILAVLMIAFLLRHSVGDWNRRRIRKAFLDMDALDAREAPDAEYEAPMAQIAPGLPGWAAAWAVNRCSVLDSPSRRRHLGILAKSDLTSLREKLVDLARDSSDPLAPEVWELLTGRHRSGWHKELVATDGKAGFGAPPPPRSGAWSGYYVQMGAEHRMELTIAFEGPQLTGAGRDIVGPFTISGELEKGFVHFTKWYPHHSVDYSGRFDGDQMQGRWTILPVTSSFRLWPHRGPVPRPMEGEKGVPTGGGREA